MRQVQAARGLSGPAGHRWAGAPGRCRNASPAALPRIEAESPCAARWGAYVQPAPLGMRMYKGKEESDGIIALVKETADGFGHLIAEHVKLARLELVADAKASGRKIAV